jgi:hypothetical protein
MNTQPRTPHVVRTSTLAALVLGLLGSAAACGDDGTATAPAPHPQPVAAQRQGVDEFPFNLVERAKARAAQKALGHHVDGGHQRPDHINSYPFIHGYPPAHHRDGFDHRRPADR